MIIVDPTTWHDEDPTKVKLMGATSLVASSFNPDQARVPKGNGRLSGRWIPMPGKIIDDLFAEFGSSNVGLNEAKHYTDQIDDPFASESVWNIRAAADVLSEDPDPKLKAAAAQLNDFLSVDWYSDPDNPPVSVVDVGADVIPTTAPPPEVPSVTPTIGAKIKTLGMAEWESELAGLTEPDADGALGDRTLAKIAQAQGWGKPDVLSPEEFDRLAANSKNPVMYRGVHGLTGDVTQTAASRQEEFLTSDDPYMGRGYTGNGYYFSVDPDVSYYADETEGSTIEAVLKPDANVINYDDLTKILEAEHEKWYAEYRATKDVAKLQQLETYYDLVQDRGRAAAMLGYDAIFENGDAQGNQEKPLYVVVNRGALAVKALSDKAPTVSNLAQQAIEGGFTFDIRTMTAPTTGFVVAHRGGSSISPAKNKTEAAKQIKEFLKNPNPPSPIFGGWFDKEHDEIVLDYVDILTDRDEAIQRGKDTNQQAIFDLSTGTEIDTGGTGDRDGQSSGVLPATGELGFDDRRGAGRLHAPARRTDGLRGLTASIEDQARVPKGNGELSGRWIDMPDKIFADLLALYPSGGTDPASRSVQMIVDMYGPVKHRPFENAQRIGSLGTLLSLSDNEDLKEAGNKLTDFGNVDWFSDPDEPPPVGVDPPSFPVDGDPGMLFTDMAPLLGGFSAPMDSKAAGDGANPLDGDVNCQMVTSAYELRRRGMANVVAKLGSGTNQQAMVNKNWEAWWDWPPENAVEGLGPTSLPPVTPPPTDVELRKNLMKANADYLAKILNKWPPGSRGFFTVTWKNGTGGGHIMNWEKDAAGNVKLIDAQKGGYREYSMDIDDYPSQSFWYKDPQIRSVYRVDNVKATRSILNGMTTTDQVEQAQAALKARNDLYLGNADYMAGLFAEREQLTAEGKSTEEVNAKISERQIAIQTAAKKYSDLLKGVTM